MTFKTELLDLLKKYGIDSEIVNVSIDAEENTIDVEVPVYDRSGHMLIVDNSFLTTFISVPLNIDGPLAKTMEWYKSA